MTILTGRRRVIGVFGANGFIGRALVSRLVRDGRPVVAFSRSFPNDYETVIGGPVETRLIDFNDVLAAHAIISDITDVVQLINSSSPGLGNSRAVDDLQSNVLPHVAFIESCLMNGIKSYVFVSSGGTVYGQPEYLPIDERHPLRPINSYGLTKVMVEQYLRMLTANSEMSAISLRVSNPFGPGQTLKKGQGLIASILRNHGLGQPVTVFGQGEARRDYLFIDDLVCALVAALDAPTMREEINIGTGVGRSILDIVAAVEEALGVALQIEFATGRATDAQDNMLDCSKAEAQLGWTAKTDFFGAIRSTVDAWTN